MKVLVACECSGTVRDAFTKKGHDATSCDLFDSISPGKHHKGDVKDILYEDWDLIIAHPPCTFLTNTGNRWFYHPDDKHLPYENRRPHPNYPNRRADREEGVEFFNLFANHPSCPKIAIENPIGILSSRYRKPDQIVQPYDFGHDASKATCLWLKGLPKLKPTNTVEVTYVTTSTGKKFSKWFWDTSKFTGAKRQSERSKTFQGIADAMANQWG